MLVSWQSCLDLRSRGLPQPRWSRPLKFLPGRRLLPPPADRTLEPAAAWEPAARDSIHHRPAPALCLRHPVAPSHPCHARGPRLHAAPSDRRAAQAAAPARAVPPEAAQPAADRPRLSAVRRFLKPSRRAPLAPVLLAAVLAPRVSAKAAPIRPTADSKPVIGRFTAALTVAPFTATMPTVAPVPLSAHRPPPFRALRVLEVPPSAVRVPVPAATRSTRAPRPHRAAVPRTTSRRPWAPARAMRSA